MSDTLRDQLRAVAVKIESSAGTDVIGGTPSASDYVACDFDFQLPQDAAPNPENTGSFDGAPPIVAGLRAAITLRCMLRGSGAAGTAPEIGKLMQACSWIETVTAVAVGAPTAGTAGSANTLTLQTPFAATAQLYRGMPLLLAGNPAAGATSFITNYTSGRVATLSSTFSPALDTSTTGQIPINVLYSPTSDESLLKTVTVYVYEDGIRHRFVGCVGRWSLQLEAGKVGMLTFQLVGQLLDAHQSVSLPSNWNTTTRQVPPIWINGQSKLNRATAKCARMMFDSGVGTVTPENPEATQGYDAPLIIDRNSRIELDPFASASGAPTRFAAFQAGSSNIYAAQLGSTAGNRIGVLLPSWRMTNFDRSRRNKLGVDGIAGQPDGVDSSCFLSFY